MKQMIITNSNQAIKAQNTIFQRMSVDKKMALWAKFWQLGKALNPNSPAYGRSPRATRQDR